MLEASWETGMARNSMTPTSNEFLSKGFEDTSLHANDTVSLSFLKEAYFSHYEDT